jgi:hypothetical protein
MRTRLTIMIIGIAVLIGLLLLSLPDVEDIPEEKMTSISMALCLADIKIDIRKRLERGLAILSNYENECPGLIQQLKISRNGKIEASNANENIRLLFIPINEGGQVKWTCSGTPAQFVPKACQQSDNQSG